MCGRPLRTFVFLLALAGVCLLPIHAQGKGKSGSSGAQDDSGGGDASGPFSIETEMFTYKAVEQNSAIIACDIAQVLYHSDFTDAPAGSHAPCAIAGNAASRPGVILVSGSSTLLTDFQAWRADMATMQSLIARAHQSCVAPAKAGEPGEEDHEHPHIRARGLLGSALGGLANPSAAAGAASDVLQLFSSNQSVTSVVGTVGDPALLNEVARQLRSLNVQVLVPELYSPFALSGVDDQHSPYLVSLQSLFDADDQCNDAKAKHPSDAAQSADVDALLGSIGAFLKASFGAPAAKSGGDSDTDHSASSPAPAGSHFAAVMAADELARKIGFSATGSLDPNSPWQHLLWLKALESGGSVTKQSNLLGSKVLFGGGAVDTYSVFRLDGELVCSGNVYGFFQPVKVKGFERAVRAPILDTPAKWASEHSNCGAVAAN